ncbi:MAG TPA: PhzF family phenazine biosynthesis protein [Thermoleophilaceae bacterium]|nr:PhzF family phenazine biosynthesis protein [Thermoleophilaceae bacterium]
MTVAHLHVLRVFVGPDGRGGNPLGVFLDPPPLDDADMQAVAADLGFSETVFVGDREAARLRIFTPAVELPLAGHPLVGTAWLLHREGPAPAVLRPPAGEVPTWQDAGLTWIRARPADAPEFDLVELGSAAEVEKLSAAPDGGGRTVAWAWDDEGAGTMRVRAFLPELGVPEDEATGSAALRLCALVGRAVEIHQGTESRISARPADGGTVDLGGRVEPVEEREYRRPGG